jgi:hypothetical protein
MNNYPWIVVGLAAFDVSLLTLVFLYLRSHATLDRRVLFPIAAGLIGFVFHAFLFFQGAILILQLATIVTLFGLVWFCPSRHRVPGSHNADLKNQP